MQLNLPLLTMVMPGMHKVPVRSVYKTAGALAAR